MATADKIQKLKKKKETGKFLHTWNVDNFQCFENIARFSVPQSPHS